MTGLAKKIRLDGGNHINQVHHLGLLAFRTEDVSAVLLKGVDRQMLEAFLQSRLKHGFFGVWQLDANSFIDKRTELFELLIPHFCRYIDTHAAARFCFSFVTSSGMTPSRGLHDYWPAFP
jgi:hypothetical protein